MLALKLQQNRARHQHQGATPKTLMRILEDDVNLAVWQRQLPLHIADFAELLLSLNEPLAESLCIELPDEDADPDSVDGARSGSRACRGHPDRVDRRGPYGAPAGRHPDRGLW